MWSFQRFQYRIGRVPFRPKSSAGKLRDKISKRDLGIPEGTPRAACIAACWCYYIYSPFSFAQAALGLPSGAAALTNLGLSLNIYSCTYKTFSRNLRSSTSRPTLCTNTQSLQLTRFVRLGELYNETLFVRGLVSWRLFIAGWLTSAKTPNFASFSIHTVSKPFIDQLLTVLGSLQALLDLRYTLLSGKNDGDTQERSSIPHQSRWRPSGQR